MRLTASGSTFTIAAGAGTMSSAIRREKARPMLSVTQVPISSVTSKRTGFSG